MRKLLLNWQLYLITVALSCGLMAQSQVANDVSDAGVDSIGDLKVSVLYGTDGDVENAGAGLSEPNAKQLENLGKLKKIKFSSYRLVGEDVQKILRSYENWANPLKQSKQILISFQPNGEVVDQSVKLDLEFWQNDKKIMKSAPILRLGKPLFILGPEWRGGRLIIAVELLHLKNVSAK